MYDCWEGDLDGKPLLLSLLAYQPADGRLIVELDGVVTAGTFILCCPVGEIVRFTDHYVCYTASNSSGQFFAIDLVTGSPVRGLNNLTTLCAPGNGYPIALPGWGWDVKGVSGAYPILR